MLRKLVGGLAVVVLHSSLLYARLGIVQTKDGTTYEGDITEAGDSIQMTHVAGVEGPMVIKRANIQGKITYPDEIGTQVHDALGKLPASDVASRISLARTAIQYHAYDAAQEAVNQAAAKDPNNREVAELRAQLAKLLPPATLPTTTPATPTTNESTGPLASSTGVGVFVVKRPITPAEINRIKQVEMRPDERGLRVKIDADTRRKFLAGYIDMTAAEFAKLPPLDQANLILSKGKENLRGGVQIQTDPASVADFKKAVNRPVVAGCAAAGCHSGPKSGSFSLALANNDAAIYTNFLVLQRSAYTAGGAQHLLVDRDYPDTSLLLQFMLPPDIADTPHPKVANFKSVVKTKSDPRYTATFHWIQSLSPMTPHYDIDLSREPVADVEKPPAK